MRWGLIPSWMKGASGALVMINAARIGDGEPGAGKWAQFSGSCFQPGPGESLALDLERISGPVIQGTVVR